MLMQKFTLFLILALVIVGCNRSKDNSHANRVVEFVLSDFERINPFNSTDANATYCEEQIFQRLLTANPKTLNYDVPELADSLPVESADHLTFDFRLRKGMKWADGQDLTGADVIFSLKALKNPFNVQSAQKRVYVDAIHSAELIDGDPYRIRFKLWKPYFLVKQAGFGDVLYILPKHIFDPKSLTDKYNWDEIAAIVEHTGDKEVDSAALAQHKNPAMQEFADWFTSSDLSRDPKYIQGSGPYKLDEWKTNDYVRLIRNKYYQNTTGEIGAAYPDTLIYKTINDWSAAVTALKARNIDLIGSLQAQYWVQLDSAKSGISKTTFPLGSFSYIGFNQRSPIFSDKGVRWAMAYLVDRDLIIDKILFGLAKKTESPISSTHPEFSDLPLIPYDPDRAKQILDSLDWKDHDGDGVRDKMIGGKRIPFKFTFTMNAGNETRKKILLVFAESLRKIGIEADVSQLEWSVFISRLRDHQIDAHYGGWINDPFEADNYQLYHSSQAKNRGSNYDSYSSARADKLMEDIRSEFDDAKRKELQRELQQVFYDDQANLFLWEPLNNTAWVNRFDNVEWGPYRPGYDISTWKVRGIGGPKPTAQN
jgi:peptide/nickel transport system substrate-binding protein